MVKAEANAGPGRSAKALTAIASAFLLSYATGCLHPPAAPVVCSLGLAPASAYPGDPIIVTGTAASLDPKRPATWTWTSTGGTVSGTSITANVNTSSLAPGTYTVTGHVSQGSKPNQIADCQAGFTIKSFEPPTISCSANPASIKPGESSTVTASGVSPQNQPLSYSYAASAGRVIGSGTTATFDSAGAPTGTTEISCSVADDNGQTASAVTTVSISAPAVPAPHGELSYTCGATPSPVRAGEPVVLSITPRIPGDSVIWQSGTGVLDVGVDTSVIDTKNLLPGNFSAVAKIMHPGLPTAGCQTGFTVDPHAPVAPWPTLNIVRIPLMPGQKENSGFAVYTYILYRRHPVSAKEIERFRNILAAVAAHEAPEKFGQHSLAPGFKVPASAPPIGRQATSRRELAPIIVPVSADGPFTVDWLFDNYDPALASQLLANLNCQRTTKPTNCRNRLSGDGPYLISTVVRLSCISMAPCQSGNPEAFLMQDLGQTSPEVGGEWVSDYMAMVTQKKSWTNGYTLQQASLDFAKSLDVAGGELQAAQASVKDAIAFFTFGAH